MAFNPLIYNPNYSEDSGYFYLPLPIRSWRPSSTWRNTYKRIPGATGRLLVDQVRESVRFDIQGEIVGWNGSTSSITVAQALDTVSKFRAALDGPFYLWRYTDELWTQCVSNNLSISANNEPDDYLRYSLSVECLFPYPYTGTDATDGASDDLTAGSSGATGSPYDTGDGGLGVSDGGSNNAVEASMIVIMPLTVQFYGIPDDTAASGGLQRYVPGTSGASLQVARLGVSGVSGVMGSGTTKVRVAKASRGNEGGTYIELDLASASTAGVETTGAFAVSPGDTLYFSVQDAVHSDIQVYADVEVSS